MTLEENATAEFNSELLKLGVEILICFQFVAWEINLIRTKYIVFIKSFYFAKSWVCMLLLQKCEVLEYLKLNLTESCF